MRDTTYIEVVDDDRSERKIESSDEYISLLRRILGRDIGDEAEALWKKVDARESALHAASTSN